MAVRVEKFLGCVRLDLGGQIIGWISFIVSSLLLTICVGILGGFPKRFRHGEKPDPDGFAVFTLLFCFLVYVSYSLAVGSKQHDSSQIKPALLVWLFSLTITTSLIAYQETQYIIVLVIQIYVCTILYSLWQQFKEEEDQKQNQTAANCESQVRIEIDPILVPHASAGPTAPPNMFDPNHKSAFLPPPSYVQSQDF